MRIFELAVTFLSALPLPPALPAASGVEQCSDVVVEVVGLEGQSGQEQAVVRITNKGSQPRDYEVDEPSPESSVPVLHITHYLVHWLESNSSSWKHSLIPGTFAPGRGTERIEPGQSKMMATSIPRLYEPDAPSIEAIMIELASRKPQCVTRSASVRLSDVARYP